jgi:hypothetical protein
LKTIQKFIKELRKKIEIKKIKIKIDHKSKDNSKIFHGLCGFQGEEKGGTRKKSH